jgi:hypothetical protein
LCIKTEGINIFIKVKIKYKVETLMCNDAIAFEFLCEWFVSKNSKEEFKTPLEMVLENWKKKQKGFPLSSLAFGLLA